MSEHISIERMNEAVDGLLSAAEMDPIEHHLESCAVCRNEYALLSETVTSIGALPKSAIVPDTVWEGISGRIGERPENGMEEETPVLELPTAKKGTRRISFTVPELAAAAILVAFISAALVWTTIGGGGVDGIQPGVALDAPGGAAARAVSLEGDRYGEVMSGLEQVLEEGRSLLAPETLVSIEESLATLNSAIEEIEAALAEDPNSDLLLRMLSNHQRTKLGVLQRAAAAVQAQT